MSYSHLTSEERFCIAHKNNAKFTIRCIAKHLSRSPSTISRELKRNKGMFSPYWYDWAQEYASERKSTPRCEKRKSHQPFYKLVIRYIRDGLSSELISGHLKREFRSHQMRVSRETIYR